MPYLPPRNRDYIDIGESVCQGGMGQRPTACGGGGGGGGAGGESGP